jgi:hypothetical protein
VTDQLEMTLSPTDEEARLMHAHSEALEAKRWIETHLAEWYQIRELCANSCKTGKQVRRDHIEHLAEQMGFDMSLTGMFRRDHNLWAALSRYLLAKHPEYSSIIKTRTSKLDEIELPELPWWCWV